MKILVMSFILLCCLNCFGVVLEPDEVKERHFAELAQKRYGEVALKLFSTNVPFAYIYTNPLPKAEVTFYSGLDVVSARITSVLNDNIGYVQITPGRKRGVWVPVMNMMGMSFDLRTERLTKIYNGMLDEYMKTNSVQSIPTLSINEAVRKAKQYLDILGIEIKPHMSLYGAQFNAAPDQTNCWLVAWEPSINGFPIDVFLSGQGVSVQFHENLGLIMAQTRDVWPLPKFTEVKISRESAILTAEKAAPLVMQTPYYRQCRLPGFKVKGVKSARLLISPPNWLLDPQRAIWIFDKPPEETRLCWVVTFETVDTVPARPRNFKPMPPDIRIYIDAATGEIVGANFT